MSDSLWSHGPSIHGIFLGKNTGVGCQFLFQGISLTQGLNLGLQHCKQMILPSEAPGKTPGKRCLADCKSCAHSLTTREVGKLVAGTFSFCGDGNLCSIRTGNISNTSRGLRCCCCWLVALLCLTLHYPMDCSTTGLSVPHHLLGFTQIHVHCMGDPAISSFDTLFSCLQSFPRSGSFSVSQLFASGDQNIGASASASVLPMNIQGWFPLELTDLVSSLSKGLSRVFFSTTVRRHQFFITLLSLRSSSHNRMWLLGRS